MSSRSDKVDRRRQNRIQGSWNSQPCWTNQNVDSVRLKSSEASSATTSKANDASRPTNQEYRFDRSMTSVAKREVENARSSEEVLITKCGVYELSVNRIGVPSTIRFFPDFLKKDEADSVFDHLCVNLPWQQRNGINREGFSYKEPRLTCWFGEPYVYSHVAWESNHEWPKELASLRSRVADATGIEYNSVMCNLYRNDKDSIGWHADDEPSLGKYPNIASLSFGCTRSFEMKLKNDQFCSGAVARNYSIPLSHGSLLIMEGSIQEDWLHRVPKEYHDRSSRINLTFRVIVSSPE